MRKALKLMVAGALAMSVVAASASAASAGAGSDVRATGTCGTRPWSLKLSHDSGRIEADYELHGLSSGSTWRLTMKDNGVRFFRGARTAGSDHSIEVDRHTRNRAGTDRITVRAVDVATGHVCSAAAKL